MVKDNLKFYFNQISNMVRNFNAIISKLFKKIADEVKQCNNSSDLILRISSSIVMLLVAIIAIAFSKGLFFLLAIAATILMTFEWLELTKKAKNQRKWRLIGFVYILIPVAAVLELRDMNSNILLWMFAVIISTDIFAYFIGKNFGGPKLMPKVSPNKTWSGLIGGVTASMMIGFLSSFSFSGSILFFILMSALISIIEQGSDLIESKFKRIFGVKDSGNIIPGHGGVLDRLDGLILVAPFTLLLVWSYPSSFVVL